MLTSGEQAFDQTIVDALRPGELEQFASEVAVALAEIDDPLPRLQHISVDEVDGNLLHLTCHVQITPLLKLPVEVAVDVTYGLPVAGVVAGLRTFWPRRETVAFHAEAERDALELLLETLGAADTEMRLREIHLAPERAWRSDGTPRIAAQIDVLGDNLRPTLVTTFFDADEHDHHVWAEIVAAQRRRADLRRRLVTLQASGLIDQVAAAALLRLPDAERAIRQLGRHDAIWPDASLRLWWRDGRVTSAGESPTGLSWIGYRFEVEGTRLPEHALLKMEGRPIVEFIDFHLLDPAMRVAQAWNDESETFAQGSRLVIELRPHDKLLRTAHGQIG